jgi:TfoX/Sxy family transcriptional regulator of competence genes
MPAQAGKWRRSPPELVETLHETIGAALPENAAVDLRPMFGYPCYWTGGNMFFATFQDDLILRLSDEDRTEFLHETDARRFEPMPGRPMREYVVVPTRVAADRATLQRWVAKGYRYAASLPSKQKKARKRTSRAKDGG